MSRPWDDIPGWFDRHDAELFEIILRHQLTGPAGDLLEIGCWYGKSAVVMGYGVRDGERLIVCDMFDTVAEHDHIPAVFKAGPPVEAFLSYWDSHHDRAALDIRQQPSVALNLRDCKLRFTHIDGCHSNSCVDADLKIARAHSQPGAVIVFDDYRNGRVPGVAAAVWAARDRGWIHPFAITDNKLYATVSGMAQKEWLDRLVADGWWLDTTSFDDIAIVQHPDHEPGVG